MIDDLCFIRMFKLVRGNVNKSQLSNALRQVIRMKLRFQEHKVEESPLFKSGYINRKGELACVITTVHAPAAAAMIKLALVPMDLNPLSFK